MCPFRAGRRRCASDGLFGGMMHCEYQQLLASGMLLGTCRCFNSCRHPQATAHCCVPSIVVRSPLLCLLPQLSRAVYSRHAGDVAEGQPMVGSQQPANPPLSPVASPGVQGGETQPAQNASRRSLGGRGGSRKGATLSELMSQRSLQVGPALGLFCQAAQQPSRVAGLVETVSHKGANLANWMLQCSLQQVTCPRLCSTGPDRAVLWAAAGHTTLHRACTL